VYKHAFELVRLDDKKRRYILAFPTDQLMNEWKNAFEELIHELVNQHKLASSQKALKHQEVQQNPSLSHSCLPLLTCCTTPLWLFSGHPHPAQEDAKEAERRALSAKLKSLKQGCDDIFDAAYQGSSPLHVFSIRVLFLKSLQPGDIRQLEVFLKAGAPVNGFDDEGLTPLMNASLQGHMGCVALLHTYGADPHLVDEQKQTCLHKAAYHSGKSAVAAFLLDKGVFHCEFMHSVCSECV
jgi:ankyrin repeat protein